MKKIRKIAVVTGTRAEYGLLYWLIKRLEESATVELQLIVTGTHLSQEFGLTVSEIERDGFPIAERVEMLLSSDTEAAISTSMGLGMIGFAKAYENLSPDILVVLGDRFEILSAVAAAVPFRIPVAHIHGGEITEGAMDELFRHAITKMSHIHFPTAEEYASRIVQMGEDPQNVHCFGAPGIENVRRLDLLNRAGVGTELNIPEQRPWGVVTFHPVTLEKNCAEAQTSELLNALSEFENIYWVFTLPNADTGSRTIIRLIRGFVKANSENSALFSSLGTLRYMSLLKHAKLMVGNSSSGIIEAPSFELPVVNIGERQKGRIRAGNILDVPECKSRDIAAAVTKALSDNFKGSLKGLVNPYGDGNTSGRIAQTLEEAKLGAIKKRFYNFKTEEAWRGIS